MALQPIPMRWSQPNVRTPIDDLLGRDKPASTAWVRHQGLERIRQAMLTSLAGGTGGEVARMNIRVRYAADIEALWYLRNDLFSTLTAVRGEYTARTTLEQVTALFQGQLPTALRAPLEHARHASH
ncbi:hypothetical protein [Acidovorax sp. RAC01]|uniref:hypothetical protein n=1 Tax=Acidovorax sp. RAC01 TaxID=1842533 RepID=UPI001E506AAC|nr:hypothetical protein [Acidovorax sp. RAC01]